MDIGTQIAMHILQIGSQLAEQTRTLVSLIGNTPLEDATANPVVNTLWGLMVILADTLLGLAFLLALIQQLYGEFTGRLSLPLSQLLGRLFLSAVLIHLSHLLGQDLLILMNEMSVILTANVADFIRQANGGQAAASNQQVVIAAGLSIAFGASLLRVVFQAVRRIVFFDVLFILSGPAFVLAFHPQTTAYFAFWARTFVTTAASQFLQYVTLGMGIAFWTAAQHNGPIGTILAIAALNLTAEIPTLLSWFATSASASVGGVGSLLRNGIIASRLLF